MKSYSADAVTKADVEEVAAAVEANAEAYEARLSDVDQKQSRQIMTLRWVVGISFAVNVALTLGLHFA